MRQQLDRSRWMVCLIWPPPMFSMCVVTGSLTAEEITPPLDAAIAACQDELDAKQAPVAGFLAVRLTVSGDDGAVSDLEARFAAHVPST